MSGTLQVGNIIGPTTGADANKVIIPSGQTLHAPGHVIQVVTVPILTSASSTAIPFDNSVPTTSEGFQLATTTITPKNVNSKIVIHASFTYDYYNSNSYMTAVLFRNSTCVKAAFESGQYGNLSIDCVDEPNTTSSVTYNLRAGGNAGATVWVHSTNGGPKFGGNNLTTGLSSEMIIMEIAQ
jgi:hypothetical protein